MESDEVKFFVNEIDKVETFREDGRNETPIECK